MRRRPLPVLGGVILLSLLAGLVGLMGTGSSRMRPPQPDASAPSASPSADAPGQGVADDLRPWLARAPRDANLILALPEGRRLIEGDAAQEDALGTVADALAMGSPAWDALAKALGMARKDALVAVGGGVLVVFARADAPMGGMSSWALCASVTPATRDQLQRALALSPREVLQGVPVLSVESGRYILALRPAPARPRALRDDHADARVNARPRENPERSELLLLAPSDEASLALVRAIVIGLDSAPGATPPSCLDVDPALRSLAALPPALGYVLVREAPAAEAGATYAGWGTHRVVALTADATQAVFHLRLRDEALVRAGPTVPRVPVAALEPAWSQAIVAYYQAQVQGLPDALQTWTLSIADGAEQPPPGASARAALFAAFPRAPAGQSTGVALALSVQCEGGPHIDASAARLDAAVRKAVKNIEALAGAEGEPWPNLEEWGGLAPEAERETSLDLPERGQGAMILGARSRVAWRIQPCLEASIGTGWSAWMHATLAPEGLALPGVPVAAEGERAIGHPRLLSRVIIRMDAVRRALPALIPMLTRAPLLAAGVKRAEVEHAQTALSVVDLVEWECWLDPREPDVACGRLTVRVDASRAKALHARSPAPPPAPAAPAPPPTVPHE